MWMNHKHHSLNHKLECCLSAVKCIEPFKFSLKFSGSEGNNSGARLGLFGRHTKQSADSAFSPSFNRGEGFIADNCTLLEPCRRSRSPPRIPSPPLVVAVVAAVVMLAGGTGAIPAGPRPRWVNPCELPGHVFDPSTDMEGAPPIRAQEIFRNVRERAFVAKKHAEDVTQKFVRTYFPDPDFIPGTSNYRQKWLPKIPPPREEDFKDITDHEALLKSFEFLQFFAVGFEQIILDQTIHGGRFLAAFRDLENDLTQVLCELQLGLFSLRVPPSPDVLRDAMSQEYRDVQARTVRNIRDYMILRDFVSAADFVAQLFGYLERTL